MKAMMTVKPSLINALFPEYARNVFYALLIMLVAFALSYGAYFLSILSWEPNLFLYLVLALLLGVVPLTWQIIQLRSTTYYFFDTHIVHEYAFFSVRRKNVPYTKIVGLHVERSFWDRLSRAGDLHIHTADDSEPDITIQFILNPQQVEEWLTHKQNRLSVPQTEQRHERPV